MLFWLAEGAAQMSGTKNGGNGASLPAPSDPSWKVTRKPLSKSLPKRAGTGDPPEPLAGELADDAKKGRVYSHHALANHEARRVAVVALCDPRAVFKYLHGLPQRAMMRERIERALRDCQLGHLVGYATRTAGVRAENTRTSGKA